MVVCPQCHRKIDGVDPPEFTMPEHQNYMKTDRCPASGRRFGAPPGSQPTGRILPRELELTVVLASLAATTPRHPRRRRKEWE